MWLMRNFLGNERSGDEGSGMIARCEHWEVGCEVMKSKNIQQSEKNEGISEGKKSKKGRKQIKPNFLRK